LGPAEVEVFQKNLATVFSATAAGFPWTKGVDPSVHVVAELLFGGDVSRVFQHFDELVVPVENPRAYLGVVVL